MICLWHCGTKATRDKFVIETWLHPNETLLTIKSEFNINFIVKCPPQLSWCIEETRMAGELGQVWFEGWPQNDLGPRAGLYADWMKAIMCLRWHRAQGWPPCWLDESYHVNHSVHWLFFSPYPQTSAIYSEVADTLGTSGFQKMLLQKSLKWF